MTHTHAKPSYRAAAVALFTLAAAACASSPPRPARLAAPLRIATSRPPPSLTGPRSAPVAPIPLEERPDRVVAALNRSRAVESCWQAAVMRDPAHSRESFVVVLDVTAHGRVRASVNGVADPTLAACIERRARWIGYGPGNPVTAEVRYSLDAGR